MRRAALTWFLIFVALGSATTAAHAGRKPAPLVAFATEDVTCTTSKTMYLAIGSGGVSVLRCEGREYDGPLSETQYEAVLELARVVSGADGLVARDRKRIQRYARAARNGDNVAEFDIDAAKAEMKAAVMILLRDVGVDRDGRLYLSPKFYTERKTATEIVRAFTLLLEDGEQQQPIIEALIKTRPPGDYGPVGIASVDATFETPPSSGTATVVLYNFQDALTNGACATDSATFDSSCTLAMVFADGAWKLSRTGFELLFGIVDTPVSTVSPE
jgi:hypothetical protein